MAAVAAGAKECGHAHCHLVGLDLCCSCIDRRPERQNYPQYVDGKGFLDIASRFLYYCPGCKHVHDPDGSRAQDEGDGDRPSVARIQWQEFWRQQMAQVPEGAEWRSPLTDMFRQNWPAGWGGTTTTAAVAPTTEQRQVEREASDRREVAGGTQPDGETVPHGHLADAYDPWEPRSTATNADYTPQEPAITDADAEEDSVPFYCPHSPYPVDCRICTDPDTLPPFFDSLVRSFVARGFREQHARELTKVLRVLRRWDEMERARVEAEHEARRDRRKRRRRRDQGGGVLPERTDIYGTGTRDDDDDVPTVQALDFRAEWVVQAIIEQTRRTRSSAWSGAELRHLAEAELDISMAAGAGAGSSGVVGAVEADADVPDGLVDTAAPSPIGLPSTALPNPDRNPDPEADLCKICLAHPTNCVLVPCGHYALCIACARRMKVEDGACPVCRQGVAMVVQTFKA